MASVTPRTCWNTPCTPQKQPPAKTAVSVCTPTAGSSITGAAIGTAASADDAERCQVSISTTAIAPTTIGDASFLSMPFLLLALVFMFISFLRHVEEFALRSAEGEGIGLGAGVQEFDAEGVVGHRAGLPHQLVQALAGDGAAAIGAGVAAMVLARRGAVDGDAEAHRFAISTGTEHQVQVAGMETVDDAPGRMRQRDLLGVGVPVAAQAPLIQFQFLRRAVVVRLVVRLAGGLREILRALIADIGFRRRDVVVVVGWFLHALGI